MNEIIFIVEEAPEGGYQVRALGESILPKPMIWKACMLKYGRLYLAILRKTKPQK
ncbi:hypothetical protein [Nitrosococcus wardiae]|uniref:hypothetical protein n=1 Tax=Nitrosococcus wardiae TaxID=1814290 RepID=UPI00197EEE24|nr:hypothetical protein [Nitrosococcus wardiae]